MSPKRGEQSRTSKQQREDLAAMPARKKEPRTLPQYYTIPEVCIILGLGRTKVLDLIRKEQLPVEKFGAASRVPMTKFQDWLEQRAQAL